MWVKLQSAVSLQYCSLQVATHRSMCNDNRNSNINLGTNLDKNELNQLPNNSAGQSSEKV